MSGFKIPFFGLERQHAYLKDELLEATDRVLASGQWMAGENTEQFEQWLAHKTHSQYAITTHSGTIALEAIAKYYERSNYIPVKRALIPTLTFPATANAFINSGWDVEFLDCNRNGQVEWHKHVDGSTEGIAVGVGLYGEEIRDVPHLPFIEDGAQHWLADDCRHQGLATTISFDPTKNLPSTGNGGAIVTNSEVMYEWLKGYFNHGKHHVPFAGTNARMSELEAAHLLVRKNYLEMWQGRRRAIARHWIYRFSDSPVRVVLNHMGNHALQKFVIEIDNRDYIRDQLANDGIETRIHYEKPLHELKQYEKYKGPNMMSVASSLTRRVLSLPFYPDLSGDEVEFIADRVLHHVQK